MSMIVLDNVSMAFGHVTLLDNVNLRIEPSERICLIGRNGEGKSTLLKIISGEHKPDHGKIEYQTNQIAYLSQEPQINPNDTVVHAVAKALGNLGQLLEEYHHLTEQLAHQHSNERLLSQLQTIQQRLEAVDGWRLEQRVNTILSRLQLPPTQILGNLSGGWQRRVTLAQVLITEPDLLLLDEPTNHLDIDTIAWLEELLLEFRGGLLFVSHDRRFMQRMATRLLELDRGKLTSYPGNYDNYLQQKEALLEAETTQAAKFDKYLAQEEVWIRQGIKARRCRNQGRVRHLLKLREERAQRREQLGKIRLNLDSGETSGRIVIQAENISKSYQGTAIVNNFSTTIMRGDRIGLIGVNGAGKTTLLKLLIGELTPDHGVVKLGTQLSLTYFDQLRRQLNPEETVVDAVAQGQEMITINGTKKHIMSYLNDFLFPPQRARSPIKSLSGGERNRVLLAQLFTKPANVLILDEPTNDLDVESLELLEELLTNYQGTLLLVSHDRYFLDNVVTSTIVFEGDGRIKEYVGGYQDWLRQRPTLTPPPPKKVESTTKSNSPPRPKTPKLNYNEQRELAALPQRLEILETQLAELQSQINQPNFYRGEKDQINQTLSKLTALEAELREGYTRWEALEAG